MKREKKKEKNPNQTNKKQTPWNQTKKHKEEYPTCLDFPHHSLDWGCSQLSILTGIPLELTADQLFLLLATVFPKFRPWC